MSGMDIDLSDKLDPARFPNMSLQMAAILGFLFEREYTTPALAQIVVTTDGHVLGRPEGGSESAYFASVVDLRANLARLGMAAGLDGAEWKGFGELVRRKLGIDLDADEEARER